MIRTLSLLFLAACMPRVQLSALVPADLTLPGQVHRIGVSWSSSLSDDPVAPVNLLIDSINSAPKFSASIISGSIADGKIAKAYVKELCGEHDALVILERWNVVHDSDSRRENRSSSTTGSSQQSKRVYVAERSVSANAAWRLYMCDTGTPIDYLSHEASDSWNEEQPTRQAANAQLPSRREAQLMMVQTLAPDYAKRIVPTFETISRKYYKGGSPDMRLAHKLVRDGEWRAARAKWSKLASNEKVGAKAQYNVAISWEFEGQLRRAIEAAEASNRAAPNKKTAALLKSLRSRNKDKRKLKRQLN